MRSKSIFSFNTPFVCRFWLPSDETLTVQCYQGGLSRLLCWFDWLFLKFYKNSLKCLLKTNFSLKFFTFLQKQFYAKFLEESCLPFHVLRLKLKQNFLYPLNFKSHFEIKHELKFLKQNSKFSSLSQLVLQQNSI